MGIKAALLDERGVFLRIDEVGSVDALTERHLPSIVACDLPPGRYLWIPDERRRPNGRLVNAYGGAFWDLDWLRRIAATRRESKTVRARTARVPRVDAPGVDVGPLVDYLEARGLA